MKKFFAAVPAFFAAVSLCACGQGEAVQTTVDTAAETTAVTAASADGESQGTAEYGNDIMGYIDLPAGWEYSENEFGEFTSVSPDGAATVESLLFTGFGGAENTEGTLLPPTRSRPL